jgi:hypothetical protein
VSGSQPLSLTGGTRVSSAIAFMGQNGPGSDEIDLSIDIIKINNQFVIRPWVIGTPIGVIVVFFHFMNMQQLDSSEENWRIDCQECDPSPPSVPNDSNPQL